MSNKSVLETLAGYIKYQWLKKRLSLAIATLEGKYMLFEN